MDNITPLNPALRDGKYMYGEPINPRYHEMLASMLKQMQHDNKPWSVSVDQMRQMWSPIVHALLPNRILRTSEESFMLWCKDNGLKASLVNMEEYIFSYINPRGMADCELSFLRCIYRADYGRPIEYKPWSRIKEDAVEACSILAPSTLGAAGSEVKRIVVTQNGVTVYFTHPPTIVDKNVDESGMVKGVVNFKFKSIPDTMLWQYCLIKKYPVALFFGVGHPLNGETVETLAIGVEQPL